MTANRQMVLVGFLQAQNCTTLASSWRHPESRTDFLTADYFQTIGRILEAASSSSPFSTTGWRCRTCLAATTPTPWRTASAA